MPRKPPQPASLTLKQARSIWLAAQRLDEREPFGSGPQATRAAVEHLGYVQIDTINVIERCHHHILWSRIPTYERAHLTHAQSVEKSVFEYWTHALAYVPTRDFRHFVARMKRHRKAPSSWFSAVGKADLRKVLKLIDEGGALTIRDIEDDVLVEKDHAWASRKPSKRALQLAFFSGLLAVSERSGMLKSYERIERHFGWEALPKPASERETASYLVDRALRAQGIVSVDSICHLDNPSKAAVRAEIERRVRRRMLVEVGLEAAGRLAHWAAPETLDAAIPPPSGLIHILSPFDPLIIQRKRTELIFGYKHIFEAYVPRDKRLFGYFTLPVIAGDEVVAAIDLKADRQERTLRVQQWSWVGGGERAGLRAAIEEELSRFEAFQFAGVEETEPV